MQPLRMSNLSQETHTQTKKLGVCVQINEITGKWCHNSKKKKEYVVIPKIQFAITVRNASFIMTTITCFKQY